MAPNNRRAWGYLGVVYQRLGANELALRAFERGKLPDGPARGASTIPMQTAKNLFLWPSRSYVRKGLELPLALMLDAIWSKRRVMENYLNVAEWGPGVYGIEAAADHHYGTTADALSRNQAARLAAVLPNPIERDPSEMGRTASRIQTRMRQMGW